MQYHQLVLLERLTLAVERLADSQECCEGPDLADGPLQCAGLTAAMPLQLRDVWPDAQNSDDLSEEDPEVIGQVVLLALPAVNPYRIGEMARAKSFPDADRVQLRDILTVGRARLCASTHISEGAFRQLDTLMEEHTAGDVWQNS